jgi:hypothetical protein
VGAITLQGIAGITPHCPGKKVWEISKVAQKRKSTAEARIRKADCIRSDFATDRLRHYTSAFLLLIEGTYV